MPLVKVLRAGQLTLPAEVRKALRLHDGDYLEAEVVGGGVMLKPVAVVDREKAWQQIATIIGKDKWTGTEPRPTAEDEERWILDVLAEEPARHA